MDFMYFVDRATDWAFDHFWIAWCAFLAVIFVPLFLLTAASNNAATNACESIGASPFEVRGSVRMCEMDDGTLVAIPEENE